MDRHEIEAQIEAFYKENKRAPSLSTLRAWTNYKVSRTSLTKILTEKMDELLAKRLGEMVSAHKVDVEMVALPEPRAPIMSDWPRIPLPALVFSDLHIPALDNNWMYYIVKRAIQMRIRRVVIVGDIFDFGHFSKWPHAARWSAEEELEDVKQVMNWLAQYMSEVHLLPGNHDDRFANRIDRQISTSWLLKQVCNNNQEVFKVYKHHHAFLGESWLVAHPRTYSRVPAQPALDLAKAYNLNVAVGHTHHFNISRYYGRWAVEMGMVADSRRLEYKQIELTTHPSSELGALIILPDERPIFLHPNIGEL